MGFDWKLCSIKVILMTSMSRPVKRTFEIYNVGQIFQFVARPGNVDNYGINFTLRHPLNQWKARGDTFENLVLGTN